MSDPTTLNTTTTDKTYVTIYQASLELGDTLGHCSGLFGTKEEAEDFLKEYLEDIMEDTGIEDIHSEKLLQHVQYEYDGDFCITKHSVEVPLSK